MMSTYKPKILICVDCGQEFIFTAAAQEYFVKQGYHHDPKRCKTCHSRFKKLARKKSAQQTSHPASS